MTNEIRRLLRSVLGGLAVTVLAALGAAYLSVVDRGPDWIRATAIVLGLCASPFWWACGVLAPRFGGPTPWLIAFAFLVNVAVSSLAIHGAAMVLRRIRLR